MSRELRDRELGRLCDVLDAVEPTAPTLCAGWDAHDLAVHLWVIKHDPASWPGVAVPALAPITRRRSAAIRQRWSYPEIVAVLRHGGGDVASMPGDHREGHRHALGEYYVHAQDVARPNGVRQARPDVQLQEALGLRVRRAARQLFWRPWPQKRGLVLEWPGRGRVRITGDGRLGSVVVVGEPSELLCWVHGRRDVANVTVLHSDREA